MYVDKLDGLADTAFHEHISNQWREEQNRCQRVRDVSCDISQLRRCFFPFAALMSSRDSQARELGGYDCTDDCSGHAAGYR
jgi:hypothetical protein